MLRNKNRMSLNWSLLSVIFRINWCQAGFDEIHSVGSDGVDALVTNVWAAYIYLLKSNTEL